VRSNFGINRENNACPQNSSNILNKIPYLFDKGFFLPMRIIHAKMGIIKNSLKTGGIYMGVRLILKEGVLTAILSGEIDHHSAREIRGEIDETASRIKPKKLVLDFSSVQFMDSSGIGLIMGRCKLMQLFGGTVEIVHLPPKIEKIVSLAGLNQLCTIKKGD
jgi:stage II sporulation protein AA (anti-sigma F factor antagonist)